MKYMTADTKVNGYMVYPRFLSTIDVSPTEKIVYVYLFNRARSSQRASRSGKFADQLGRVCSKAGFSYAALAQSARASGS